MSTDFPTSIDPLTPAVSPTDPRNNPSLAGKINDLDDTVVALQTKVGVDSSAVTTSLDYRSTNVSGMLFASGVPAGGTGVNGNLYTNTATGIVYRKAAGSWSAIYTPASGGGVSPAVISSLKGWTWDLATWGGGAVAVPTGNLMLARISIPSAATITNVVCYCTTAGTVSRVYAGLYTDAGALLSQSANFNASWGTGRKTIPLGTPQAVTAGVYYVAFLVTSSSNTSLARHTNDIDLANTGTAIPTSRWAQADTGLTTTMPANFGTQTPNSGLTFWFGVS